MRYEKCLRYWGNAIELAKGKFAVEVAQAKDLTATLDAIKTAVLAGELDAQIDAAATKLRAGFTK